MPFPWPAPIQANLSFLPKGTGCSPFVLSNPLSPQERNEAEPPPSAENPLLNTLPAQNQTLTPTLLRSPRPLQLGLPLGTPSSPWHTVQTLWALGLPSNVTLPSLFQPDSFGGFLRLKLSSLAPDHQMRAGMSAPGNVLSVCLPLSHRLGHQSREQVCLAPWGSPAPITTPNTWQRLSA